MASPTVHKNQTRLRHTTPPWTVRHTLPAIWLLSLGLCLVSTLAAAQESPVREQTYTAPLVHTAPLVERAFPEAALYQALDAALHPGASWSDIEAAIRHFALYAQRPWASDVIATTTLRHAEHVVLNADYLWRLQPQWTARALDMLATERPTLMLRHAAVVLAADRHGASERLHRAAQRSPASAVSLVRTYEAEPWGRQLFTNAALAVPRWTVRVALTPTADGKDVLAALQRSTDPAMRVLAQIVAADVDPEIRLRMAVFVPEIVTHQLSLAEATRLSTHEMAYFRTLAARYQASAPAVPRGLEEALHEDAATLMLQLNERLEQPDTQRFRALEPWTAHELAVLLLYGSDASYTSSYQGVFARLLTRLRQDGLSGSDVLASASDSRVRHFVTAAAGFQRLDAWLATLPSPMARRALLKRLVSGLERTPELLLEATRLTMLLQASLDADSLQGLQETLLQEYERVTRTSHAQARTVYGLLAAWLGQRTPARSLAPAFAALTQRYQGALPDAHAMPLAALFPQGLNVQRHFFSDDVDGQQSFHNFMSQYRRAPGWHLQEHETFIHLAAAGPQRRIEIYANKPGAAGRQAVLDRLLQQRGYTPHVIVHRGHRPTVAETLSHLPATAALVFLGHCEGYRDLDLVSQQAPEAQIMSTRGIGTLTINDPLLKQLNEYLLRSPSGRWPDFWQQAAQALGHHARFGEYVPPHHNTRGLFMRAYQALTEGQRPWRAPEQPLPLTTVQGPAATLRR